MILFAGFPISNANRSGPHTMAGPGENSEASSFRAVRVLPVSGVQHSDEVIHRSQMVSSCIQELHCDETRSPTQSL